ncbi:rod shape-determining protein MreC [Porphyromonas sp. COT-239 OH1446]|uniref:rod shape-determining protein MreC n=1 Tax=Porphyromonas sp. COT-239 OH1446 TaxID=1515613 RepID=UPI00052DFE27|nr:rod shape-determining protein MreC [Porphyromonas sp. COT-239 OH1446]KGN71684.1 hypothetical protein HQ37_01215 [Porphyromonas sp. COT-239 OH1446]
MRRLIEFLLSKKHWFVFLLLQSFALFMLLSDGIYHRHLGWVFTGWVTGHANEIMTEGYSYLNLRDKNELLLAENARLKNRYIELERRVRDEAAQAHLPQLAALLDSVSTHLGQKTQFVTARIINLTNKTGEIYYIINRGRSHGLRRDMPVMSDRGVLGAVLDLSDSYAVIIPIINSKLRLSCTIKGKGYKGTLSSQGFARSVRLGDVPIHAQVSAGDTIQTSGFSFLFPEGLMVGVVQEADSTRMTGAAGAFANYKVSLATDFEQLSYVYVLLTPALEEAEELQKKILSSDNV